MGYSKEIAEAWKAYFARDDAHYSFDEGTGIFRTGYAVSQDGPVSNVEIGIFVKDDGFSIRSVIPGIKSKQSNMENTAMLLSYINDGLIHGNFEMDMNDGEITFKVSTLLPPGVSLEYEFLDHHIVLSLIMVDKFADALVKIMLGYSKDPKAAYNEAISEKNGENSSGDNGILQ